MRNLGLAKQTYFQLVGQVKAVYRFDACRWTAQQGKALFPRHFATGPATSQTLLHLGELSLLKSLARPGPSSARRGQATRWGEPGLAAFLPSGFPARDGGRPTRLFARRKLPKVQRDLGAFNLPIGWYEGQRSAVESGCLGSSAPQVGL